MNSRRVYEFSEEKYGKKVITLDSRLKKVLKIFSNYNLDRILDVGCGDGSFSLLLKSSSNAKEVYGIDISEKATKSAREKGIKAFRLDINEEDFPFKENYFDAIFCGEVVEHLFDTDHLLKEVYRVLRNGGYVVITTPNLAYWCSRIALFLGYQPYYTEVSLKYNVGKFHSPSFEGASGHIRAFTYRSLSELVKILAPSQLNL